MELLLRTPKKPEPILGIGWFLLLSLPLLLWASHPGNGQQALRTSLLIAAPLAILLHNSLRDYRGSHDLVFLAPWRKPSVVLADIFFFAMLVLAGRYLIISISKMYQSLFFSGAVGLLSMATIAWCGGCFLLLLHLRASVQARSDESFPKPTTAIKRVRVNGRHGAALLPKARQAAPQRGATVISHGRR